MRNMIKRLRENESGFGLIELLMAMTVLNIGILALVTAFSSGSIALNRASKISTAAALADKQMEVYRALRYDSIALDYATTNALVTTDNNYSCDKAIRVVTTNACGSANRKTVYTTNTLCTGSPLPDQCQASRTVTGPDNRSYRIDSYVVQETLNGTSRDVKVVTIVVRDSANLAGSLIRAQSTFDLSTGS